MPWFGQIESLRNANNNWEVSVAYFNDENPDKRILRTVHVPLSATKAVLVAEIKSIGVEIIRTTTLNAERIVGQTIPVP